MKNDQHILPAPERLLRFMNSFRSTGDPKEWLAAFRRGIAELFDDIDRVSVDVDFEVDLRTADNESEKVTDDENTGYAQQLWEKLAQADFPFQQYHPPLVVEVRYGVGKLPIGVLVFWRSKIGEDISPATRGLIETLRPFWGVMLSDLIVNTIVRRRVVSGKDEVIFASTLNELVRECGLSPKEQEVTVLLLLGHGYQGIAEDLGIRLNTVRRHVASIYRKTGVHCRFGLISRYFTPSCGIEYTEGEEEFFPVYQGARSLAELRRLDKRWALSEEQPTSQMIIDCLNKLPTTERSLGLLQAMHAALHILFPGFRLSSTFAMAFDFSNRRQPSAESTGIRFLKSNVDWTRGTLAESTKVRRKARHERLIDSSLRRMYKAGMQDDNYFPPLVYGYEFDGEDIGGLIMRRERYLGPVPQEIPALMGALELFFEFLLCDLVLRHQYAEPMTVLLKKTLDNLERETRCTELRPVQQNVLMYRMIGMSYKEIGVELSIAPDTVKKHAGSIRRTLNIASLSEILLKYSGSGLQPNTQ